jgi:uncharacterized protein (DUF2141 family)
MPLRRIPLMLALAALALPVAAAPAAPQPDAANDGSCAAGPGPRVRVTVTGLKDRSGRMKLELYPANEADFLKDDRELRAQNKPFRRVWSNTPQSGPVVLCIRAPSAGRWALLFTHDRDGKNKFNFWQDGAGFVSGQRLGRSRPSVDQAVINVGPNGANVAVRAQYLRGLSGFGPLD